MKSVIISIIAALGLTACATGADNARENKPRHELVESTGWTPGSRRFSYHKSLAVRVALPLFKANIDSCTDVVEIDWVETPFKMCAQKIQILRGGHVNAYTDGPVIYITEGALRLPENWLAFLIAHELAHSTLGHDIESGSKIELELEADAEAIRLMHKAGYDPQTVPFFVEDSTGNMAEPSETHPSTQQRLDVINPVIREVMGRG